jgi:Rieske 2Fe-2S family protein
MSELQPALDRHHYTSRSSFEHERDTVLRAEWTCIGRLDALGLALPGSAELTAGRRAVVDLLGESVVVTVDRDGRLHSFANVCRHRGSQLVPVPPGAGAPGCDAKALRCPYHSWTYGLDGQLLHAPHTDGVRVEADQFSLHELGSDTWGGWLWLNGRCDVPPLSVSLGEVPGRVRRYPLDTLVVGRRLDYQVGANWKVLAENYNECYHCGPVHPELTRLVPAFGGGGADLAWEEGIEHREGAWTFTMSGTSDRAPFPDLDDAERVRHKGELVYPNLLLSLSAEHVAAFVLRPVDVGRTDVTCELLFAPAEAARPDFDPDDAAELWDLVNRQDWAICESVQRGMTSRYFTQGWYAPMEDASLDIRRWLLPRLSAAPAPSPSPAPSPEETR